MIKNLSIKKTREERKKINREVPAAEGKKIKQMVSSLWSQNTLGMPSGHGKRQTDAGGACTAVSNSLAEIRSFFFFFWLFFFFYPRNFFFPQVLPAQIPGVLHPSRAPHCPTDKSDNQHGTDIVTLSRSLWVSSCFMALFFWIALIDPRLTSLFFQVIFQIILRTAQVSASSTIGCKIWCWIPRETLLQSVQRLSCNQFQLNLIWKRLAQKILKIDLNLCRLRNQRLMLIIDSISCRLPRLAHETLEWH